MTRSYSPIASKRAFSVVEVLIVLAGALVVAGLSVPVLRGITLATNAESAVETMRQWRDFQIRFKELGMADAPDGSHRFGTVKELMSSGFVLEDAEQREGGQLLLRHGYFFRMYFATRSGAEMTPNPAAKEVLDSKDAFVIYAWPERYGETGASCFALDPAGRLRVLPNGGVLESRNLARRYSGIANIPGPYAARLAPQSGTAASAPATKNVSAVGEDGDQWEVVPFSSR